MRIKIFAPEARVKGPSAARRLTPRAPTNIYYLGPGLQDLGPRPRPMPTAIGRGYRPFDTFRFVGFFGAWDFGAMGLGLGQRYI